MHAKWAYSLFLYNVQYACARGVKSYRPAVAVNEILHIYTHCTGALIQNGKLGLVVEQSGHLNDKTHTNYHSIFWK